MHNIVLVSWYYTILYIRRTISYVGKNPDGLAKFRLLLQVATPWSLSAQRRRKTKDNETAVSWVPDHHQLPAEAVQYQPGAERVH